MPPSSAAAQARARRIVSHLSPPRNKADLLEVRLGRFCGAQSVSYQNTNPLWMVHGQGSRMYDDAGIEYLDTRNNVCHLGHAHPAVAKAVADQVVELNTNSRYLHHHLCELSERLLATFPPELSVCFFVNSGSEANDLALRLARTHTKYKALPDHCSACGARFAVSRKSVGWVTGCDCRGPCLSRSYQCDDRDLALQIQSRGWGRQTQFRPPGNSWIESSVLRSRD
jgi:hypothetical protein